MTAPKNLVSVMIGGESYNVRSELPPEYTREVARFLDDELRRIQTMIPSVDPQKAAILAALAITNQLFESRRAEREVTARLGVMVNDLARLLPPAKRGSRGSGGVSPVE